MEVNYGSGEVSLKIVFYGPGLSGKTTNLEIIHAKTPDINRGKLTSIATQQDRTLFFDFMPIDLGKVSGLKTKLRLFTVPGQVYYNATRKLVLQRVDGLVFVADSQRIKKQENLDSFQNLRDNLTEQGIDIRTVPLVLQYNKRDLPDVMSMEEMDALLNSDLKVPAVPAVAVTGEGVFPTLKTVAGLVLKVVEDKSTHLTRPATRPGSTPHVGKPGSSAIMPQAKISAETTAGASPATTTVSGPHTSEARPPLPAKQPMAPTTSVSGQEGKKIATRPLNPPPRKEEPPAGEKKEGSGGILKSMTKKK